MMNRPAIRRGARVLSGAAILLFVAAAFAAPLWAALSLCAMPCCHHGAAPGSSFAGDNPCTAPCTITAVSDDVAAAVAPQTSPAAPAAAVYAAVAVAQPAPPPPALHVAAVAELSCAPERPLHLVNSVFLI